MKKALSIFLFLPSLAWAAGLQTEISSRSVSEPMAIKAFTDQWDNRLHSGDIAWTRDRLEFGVNHGAFYVGYIQRYDYTLRFNDETADLYYREENDLAYPEGDVPVRLHAWHSRAQGVKFAWHWQPFPGLSVQPSLSLLNGWEFQDGSLQGFLRHQDDALTGQADLVYRYTDDLLLDHQFDKPAGRGFAVDLLLRWQADQHSAELEIQDLYGRLRWRQAPYTFGKFNTVDRGASDIVRLDPAFSGTRSTEDYLQRLPAYVTGEYRWQRENWQWQLNAELFLSRLWLRPGVSWSAKPGNPYLGYEVRDGQWVLGIQDDEKRGFLQFGSDTWNLEDARSLTLRLGYQYQW